jgi:superfamily II DNA or RNA helicase
VLASPDVAQAFAQTAFAGTLHRHQLEALDTFEAGRAGGGLRWCLELPPGAGKTVVALEAVRRLACPTLVLCPNAGVQAQWLAAWHRFTPATVAATGGRVLWTPITVLPARSLAPFDAEGEVDEDGQRSVPADADDAAEDEASVAVIGAEPAPALPGSLAGLSELGRELAERLGAGGPWTLVLDEVHHLLEIWGDLLPELIAYLGPDTAVVGLAASPNPAAPTAPTPDSVLAEHRLTSLLGPRGPAPSTPAGVRAGLLAPYQELAYLTAPTPEERLWLVDDAARFSALCADLLRPDFTTSGFLPWCRTRFLSRPAPDGDEAASGVPWRRFAGDEPALTDAALRLHFAGLIELPPGAQLLAEHRHPPTAPDWLALITDYADGALAGSTDPVDAAAYDAIWTALPAARHRPALGPVSGADGDPHPALRVLARSAAKPAGAATVLGIEHAQLGDRLRALVLCDHERVRAALPNRLVGVLDADAGSATLVLEHLLGQDTTVALDPVLMTARTVACGRATAVRLRAWLLEHDPKLDLALLPMRDGPQGGPRGSDTGLVQLAGRGWTPRRWVPLVTRFFDDGGTRALVGTRSLLGEGWDCARVNVVVDLTCSRSTTAIVQTRGRASRLDPSWPEKVATTWTVVVISDEHPAGHSDYRRFVATQAALLAPDAAGAVLPGVAHVDPSLDEIRAPVAADLPVIQDRVNARAAARDDVLAGWEVGVACGDAMVAAVQIIPTRGRTELALLTAAPACEAIADIAAPVAQALHAAGLIVSDRVETLAGTDGSCLLGLAEGSPDDVRCFAEALVEVLGPLEAPTYVVSRRVVPPPVPSGGTFGLDLRRLLRLPARAADVWHAVPTVLSGQAEHAALFLEAWQRHVVSPRLLLAGEGEGAAAVAAQGDRDPTGVSCVIRLRWR